MKCNNCGYDPDDVQRGFDPSSLRHGLYRIFWISGGSSLASVGSYSDGRRWFAATNWVLGESNDWSGVDSVQLIERS